jgi:predicted PurR-regulated permease PerM
VLGTLAFTIGALSFVGSQFTSQFGDIRDQVGQGIDEIRGWFRDTFGISDTQVDEWIDRAREQLASGESNVGQTAAQAGLTVTHLLAGFFIAMFALFFFLYEGERIWAWVVRLFPGDARERVHSSGVIAWGQLSAFTRATILVAAVDALGIGLVAAFLGVPFASGVAVLVFFGAFVPVIGALISGAVPVLLALVALGPVQALIMLGGVIAVQQLESHVLQPFLLGRAVRVHPLAVILGIAGGVVVAGIVGALIAVPLVAVLNAVGHHLLDGDEAPDDADEMLTPAEQRQRDEEVAEQRHLDEEALEEKLPGR